MNGLVLFSARNIPTIFDESKTFRILISCYCHGFMVVFFCWVYVTQQAKVELRHRFVLSILVVDWAVVVGLGFHEWRECGSSKGMRGYFWAFKNGSHLSL